MTLYVPTEKYSRAVILAPGPSLTPEQADYIRSKDVFTIVIGDAYRFYPDADIMYHCDKRWWDHYDGVPEFRGGQRVSLEDCQRKNIKNLLKSSQREGIDLTQSTVVGGSSSGYQSIGLALHHGVDEIILCGYDYKRSTTGKYNVIGHHPKEIPETKDRKWELMLTRMKSMIKPLADMGVSVYNCTIDTDLDCFPREKLTNVL